VSIVTKNVIYKRQFLCTTISGLRVPVITVTSRRGKGLVPYSKRKAVLITARVHPGESNSSHVFEGVFKCITDLTPDANNLRGIYVFKFVPCLNPDGVVCGNY
jgi:murein tripeptide amidase MpaA